MSDKPSGSHTAQHRDKPTLGLLLGPFASQQRWLHQPFAMENPHVFMGKSSMKRAPLSIATCKSPEGNKRMEYDWDILGICDAIS